MDEELLTENDVIKGNPGAPQPQGTLHDIEVMRKAIRPVEETGETGGMAIPSKEAHDTSEHLRMDPVRMIAEIGRAKREEQAARYLKRRAGHSRKMEARRKPRNAMARASRKRNR